MSVISKRVITLKPTASVRNNMENVTLYGRSTERRNLQHKSTPLLILDATQYVVLVHEYEMALGSLGVNEGKNHDLGYGFTPASSQDCAVLDFKMDPILKH
jgi:hypothetical protein